MRALNPRLAPLVLACCCLAACGELSNPGGDPYATPVEYLEDPAGVLEVRDVESSPYARLFTRGDAPRFGSTRSTYWARLPLATDPADPRILTLRTRPPLSRVELYLPVGDAGRYDVRVAGRSVRRSRRALHANYPSFALPPGLDASRPAYLKATSLGPLALPVALEPLDVFLRREQAATAGWSVVVGVLLAALLGFLLFAATARDLAALAMAAFVLFFLGSLTSSQDLLSRYLWPERPDLTWPAVSLCFGAMALTATLFHVSVLATRLRTPTMHAILLALACIVAGQRVAAAAEPGWRSQSESATALLLLVALLVSAAWRWKQGFAPAKLLLASWALLTVGMVALLGGESGAMGFSTAFRIAVGAGLGVFALWAGALYARAGMRRKQAAVEERSAEQLRVMEKLLEEVSGRLTDIFGRGRAAAASVVATAVFEAQNRAAPGEAWRVLHDLADFANPERTVVQSVNLRELLERHRGLLERLVAPGSLEWGSAPAHLAVRGRPGHLLRVLVNLVVNAAEATGGGGKIAVSARFEPPQAAGGSPRRFAVLSVTDDGIGVDAAIQRRLLERRAPTDGGPELGLAAVDRIAREAGGWVEVHSELGSGATVRVHWPVAEETSAAARAQTA